MLHIPNVLSFRPITFCNRRLSSSARDATASRAAAAAAELAWAAARGEVQTGAVARADADAKVAAGEKQLEGAKVKESP